MLIKISIVVFAFYFIQQKLTTNSELDNSVFIDFLHKNKVFSSKTILLLLILSFFNWFFEILKWQILVSATKKITFINALQQCLGSLTASLFTPNRIGEYGAKAIYFSKDLWKRIMLINLLNNLLQMSVTVILGVIGLSFFMIAFQISINYYKILFISIIATLSIIFLIFVIVKTKFRLKGFSFEKIKAFILDYPKKLIYYGICLSVLRYVIFSFQFYYLLTVFGVHISYSQGMTLITTIYLFSSILPSIFILDVLIKGSVAVYLFTFIGVNTITVLSIVTIMWLFNFVIPSIPGSYFVLSFKLPKETESI